MKRQSHDVCGCWCSRSRPRCIHKHHTATVLGLLNWSSPSLNSSMLFSFSSSMGLALLATTLPKICKPTYTRRLIAIWHNTNMNVVNILPLCCLFISVKWSKTFIAPVDLMFSFLFLEWSGIWPGLSYNVSVDFPINELLSRSLINISLHLSLE